jgi:mRNA interferase MazF
VATDYVPDAGHIVWLHFSPQAGHEQAGHRPAVVLSTVAYNNAAGLMFCCPTTTRVKNHPFEVVLAGVVQSVALVDHARSVDWRARGASYKGRASPNELAEIRAKLRALIG